ncbi:S41 family peptidase [Clostridium sp. WILCCON 0269]|uniref:S41 family peptidase n=1 Tax=Candidatus Clostridium eludens TaxID=3381663 RepID=A0ABW8SG20_9CLOT
MKVKSKFLGITSPEKSKVNFNVKNIFVVFWLMIFIFSFAVSVHAQDSNVLNEVRDIIKNNYVTDVPDSVLNSSSVEEILKQLNDPYSEYFSAEEEKDFLNSIDNKICGIGIEISEVSSGTEISAVIKDSPAEAAGLKEGDIIASVDSHSLSDLSIDEIGNYIRGEEGTTVNIKVQREDKILNFNIQRSQIQLSTVEGKMLDNNIAYICISSFGENTSQKFSEILEELEAENPESYVIDLRNDGGGYMYSAVDIAGNFVGDNLALIVEDRYGNKVGYLAGQQKSIIDKPIIFLTNKYTASASEILSAAVKDYKKALFIGNVTYGKGVAQQVFQLSNGDALKLTTQKFYSPFGNVIQGIGIKPDFDTGDVDALKTAQLLSGECKNDVDKRGFVKVVLDKREFDINLNTARSEDYWSVFKYIIDHVDKSNVYIGTINGWANTPDQYFNNIYKFFYPDYKVLSTLEQIPQDKSFTVTLNKKINLDLNNNVSMEIINSSTGKRVAFQINILGDNKMIMVPKEKLDKGQTYYIKIKDTIKPVVVKN